MGRNDSGSPIGRLPPGAGQLAERLLLLHVGADDRLAGGPVPCVRLVDGAGPAVTVRALPSPQGPGNGMRLKPHLLQRLTGRECRDGRPLRIGPPASLRLPPRRRTHPRRRHGQRVAHRGALAVSPRPPARAPADAAAHSRAASALRPQARGRSCARPCGAPCRIDEGHDRRRAVFPRGPVDGAGRDDGLRPDAVTAPSARLGASRRGRGAVGRQGVPCSPPVHDSWTSRAAQGHEDAGGSGCGVADLLPGRQQVPLRPWRERQA